MLYLCVSWMLKSIIITDSQRSVQRLSGWATNYHHPTEWNRVFFADKFSQISLRIFFKYKHVHIRQQAPLRTTKYLLHTNLATFSEKKGDFLSSSICFCWHCLNFPAISEISPLTDHVSLPCNEFMGDPNLWELPKFLFGVKVITSICFQWNNKLFLLTLSSL